MANDFTPPVLTALATEQRRSIKNDSNSDWLTFTPSRFNVVLDLGHELLSIPVEPCRRMDGACLLVRPRRRGCQPAGDEAVPMLFRIEPDRRRAAPDAPQLRIREPKCMDSIGISTHEVWPDDLAGKRIYLFTDHGWREDLSLLAGRKLP